MTDAATPTPSAVMSLRCLGAFAGKPPLALRRPVILVGSTAGCALLLKSPAIDPRHAVLIRAGNRLWLRSFNPQRPAIVNGRAASLVELADGDRVDFDRFSFQASLPPRAPDQAAPDVSPLELRQVRPLGGSTHLDADHPIVVIGGAAGDVTKPDALAAIIHRSENGYQVTVFSTDAVLNGQPADRQTLQPGDRLVIDSVEFLLADPAPVEPMRPPASAVMRPPPPRAQHRRRSRPVFAAVTGVLITSLAMVAVFHWGQSHGQTTADVSGAISFANFAALANAPASDAFKAGIEANLFSVATRERALSTFYAQHPSAPPGFLRQSTPQGEVHTSWDVEKVGDRASLRVSVRSVDPATDADRLAAWLSAAYDATSVGGAATLHDDNDRLRLDLARRAADDARVSAAFAGRLADELAADADASARLVPDDARRKLLEGEVARTIDLYDARVRDAAELRTRQALVAQAVASGGTRSLLRQLAASDEKLAAALLESEQASALGSNPPPASRPATPSPILARLRELAVDVERELSIADAQVGQARVAMFAADRARAEITDAEKTAERKRTQASDQTKRAAELKQKADVAQAEVARGEAERKGKATATALPPSKGTVQTLADPPTWPTPLAVGLIGLLSTTAFAAAWTRGARPEHAKADSPESGRDKPLARAEASVAVAGNRKHRNALQNLIIAGEKS